MKVMNKSLLKRVKKSAGSNALQDVKREIAILKKLDHKNIVRLFEVIDDEENDKLFLGQFLPLGSHLSLRIPLIQLFFFASSLPLPLN